MTEVELKLLLDARQERMLRSGDAVKRATIGRSRTRTLHSTYFDTQDDRLKKAAIALRLRRDGKRWVQTVKKSTNGIAQGLSTPIEDECDLPGPSLDLSLIRDEALRAEVIGLSASGIGPVVETEFRRTTRNLKGPSGAKVELAIDVGEVRANGSAAPLSEAEFEVKDGPQDDIFALARDLVTQGPVRFSNRSKSDRAGSLRKGGRAVDLASPVKASSPRLHRNDSVEQAAILILNEIQHQIAANIVAAVDSDTLAAPHQLRIGLRRLRVALGAFRPAFGCEELDQLRERARDLGATVGTLRDLDVLAEDILTTAAEALPTEHGFAPLMAAVATQRAETSQSVRAILAGPAVAGFVLDLAGFVATRRWRTAEIEPAVLQAPVRGLAAKALDHRWRSLKKHAKEIRSLPIEARHEMRKEIKKLRYLSEMFGGLYPKKRITKFRRSLRQLQDDFGFLNDAATAEMILAGSGSFAGGNFINDDTGGVPAADNPAAQRAAGRLLGSAHTMAEHRWPNAVHDWQSLKKLGPFWR